MLVVELIVTVSVALSVAFFGLYIGALFQQPTGHRPKTPVYDRFGRKIGESENPGYEETEDETRG